MNNPLNFSVFSRSTVEMLTAKNPISQGFLTGYLESRPGILDDGHCDIIEHNCRSTYQRWADFGLFKRNDQIDNNTVLVFPFWLELFEADDKRENIRICLDFLRNLKVKNNPVVIQWNHDIDASTVPELQDLPNNFFVLQFNTSRPSPNDIILPFWAINTNPPGEHIQPTILAGFTGNGGTECRRRLRDWVWNKPGYQWSEERVNEEAYFLQMRNCHFSLCPRGGGLGSYRTYESIQCMRPPVIFSDSQVLPYSDSVDWSDFAFHFPERPNIEFKAFDRYLRFVTEKLWFRMQNALEAVRPKFSLLGVQQEIHKRISEFLA